MSQTSNKAAGSSPATSVKSIRMVTESGTPVIEILSTKPLIPSIQPLDNPPRLVIDLPNSRLGTSPKRIRAHGPQIRAVRVNQFQEDPPITRVVLDLLTPLSYTWEAAGNRLAVRLRTNQPAEPNKAPQEPTVASLTSGPKPLLAAAPTSGPVAFAGSAPDTSLSAGPDTTTYNIGRGGEVHVCPGTAVSMTPSQNGHNLMFGLNTGAFEIHYPLDASSDSVMTPDFRILFAGPGAFHYAVSVDARGNTCVRSLPGNTASAIVSELMGERTYQVKATDQLVFRSGHLDQVDMSVPLECGCPPRPPVQQSVSAPPVVIESSRSTATPQRKTIGDPLSPASKAPMTPPAPAAAPSSSGQPGEVQVQVDAPFIFRATGPPPAPVEDARALPPDSRVVAPPALNAPLPPSNAGTTKSPETQPPATAVPRRGFFRKLGGFFAALFR